MYAFWWACGASYCPWSLLSAGPSIILEFDTKYSVKLNSTELDTELDTELSTLKHLEGTLGIQQGTLKHLEGTLELSTLKIELFEAPLGILATFGVQEK